MRIWLLSDTHCEINEWAPASIPDADVCVVPGDIHRGAQEAVEWLAQHIRPHMPVIGLLGNHEFYGHWLQRERSEAQWHGRRHDVQMLDDMTWTIGSTRFVGSTLWTDFDLGTGGDERERHATMAGAQAAIRDYSRIGNEKGRFTPETTRLMHKESVRYIESVLATPFDGDTVVLTHHSPSPRSIAERFSDDGLNGAWHSDLEWLIEKYQPAAWFHGHVHDSFDYEIGSTRIVCNPRDYYGDNPDFDPGLVIEIGEPKPKPPTF